MAQINAGNGIDGNATDSVGTNLSTTSLVGRSYADMISYNCSSVGGNSAVTTATPNGIVEGDDVLLLCAQGTPSDFANVGNYETFRVTSVNNNTVTFDANKTKDFGAVGGDTNIGTLSTNIKVILQRIPNYTTFTVNNGVTTTCDTWDGTKGGVLFVKASGTATINGSMSVSTKGYRAGWNPGGTYGQQGESISGAGGQSSANNQGGGGGDRVGQNNAGGGGYGTAGTNGATYMGTPLGGTVYGAADLLKIYLGSGGGHYQFAGPSGAGGGLIFIVATTLHIYGTLSATGGVSASGGGDGSGGSILIHAGALYTHSSTLVAVGYGTGVGSGGDGRIAIYYNTLGDSLVTTAPITYTDDTLELPFSISGTTTEDGIVYIMDSSMVKIGQGNVTFGSYEVGNLPGAGPYHIIGIPTDSNEGALIFRDVTAQ